MLYATFCFWGFTLNPKLCLGVKAASKGVGKASIVHILDRKILSLEGVKAIVTFDTHLPLNERLMRIDHIQARRYSKLNGVALEIATEGIVRHLKACDRMDVNPETSAVREIIDDALNGRRVFAETKEHTRAA
jgi:hypothetical protein